MVAKAESGNWDDFVELAREYVDSGRLREEELDYKEELGRQLSAAREAVLGNNDNWLALMLIPNKTRQGHPVYWRNIAEFNNWCAEPSGEALDALKWLWAYNSPSVSERIRAFSERFPKSVVGGTGVRTTLISYLLMGLDVHRYPPFKYTTINKACAMAGFDRLGYNWEENDYYDHMIRFLERFGREAEKRGVALHNGLEAQSVVWAIVNDRSEDAQVDVESLPSIKEENTTEDSLEDLAEELYVPIEFLQDIKGLVEEKRQVIFQGPPGTGKTYIAQKLARCLAGSDKRVTLVQFHPSYAYEDFVQGFRPKTMKNGQPGFELRDGPLLRAAKQAESEPDWSHYLIIDEINRGNLAKVLGELYFLLEYRDKGIALQYSDERSDKLFSLPDNLYIIGTMNTADRSIARVDMALRRRFYFVEFHPDENPIDSVLRNWLQENVAEMEWVADVVDRVNEKLKNDRYAAIGPSYFMRESLDEAGVERIWKHSVLPYIEELRFGESESLKDFDLDTLRNKGAFKPTKDGGGQMTDSEDDDASA